MASYLDKDEFDRDAYVVLDMINEDELTWRTYKENTSSYVKKLFARKNIDNLRRFRSRKQAFFNLVLSVSHREREFTQTWLPRNIGTDVVPNGIASEFLEESASSIKEPLRKNILFCGSLDIAMNQEAVRKFTSHVFPKIRRVVAEARFWVIGRNPSVAIRKMSSEQIVVTGSVPDVRPYYRQASVAVAPFEFGGGTKLKIIEALALHVPLVSTSIGVQGIDVVDGHHLLIRDDWDRFAEAVIRLLQDESLGQTLANQGRRLVKERYTWDAIMGEFLRRHSDVFAE